MTFRRKLQALLPSRRDAQEQDMQEELESLKAMAERKELGNLTLVAEDARSAWTFVWIEQLLQDLRYALCVGWAHAWSIPFRVLVLRRLTPLR